MVDSRSLVSEGHIGFPLVSVYLIGWGLCALRRPLLGFPRPVFIKKYFVGNIQGGVWRTHSAFLPHRGEKNFRFQEPYFRDVYLTTLFSFLSFYSPTNFSLQFTWILGGDIVNQNMHSEDGRFKAHIPSLIEIWINGRLFIFFTWQPVQGISQSSFQCWWMGDWAEFQGFLFCFMSSLPNKKKRKRVLNPVRQRAIYFTREGFQPISFDSHR